MLPAFAIMGGNNEIYINMYGKDNVTIQKSGNKIYIDQVSDYPVTDRVELNINPEKPENFTLAVRIPKWSLKTEVSVNGTEIKEITPGTYLKINRIWNKYDKVVLKMDLSGRLIKLNGHQAIVRGPVVLARDSRFGDGFIYESAVVRENNGYVELQPSAKKPAGIWMSFTAPLVLGTDMEGEFRNPKQVNFCDFASAGNTWGEDSRYKVWIPQTLNVMKTDYKAY
jgi:DUF1680 family protein